MADNTVNEDLKDPSVVTAAEQLMQLSRDEDDYSKNNECQVKMQNEKKETNTKDVDHSNEEIGDYPKPKNQKYRSLAYLYQITKPMNAQGEENQIPKKKRN